ncbi:MAG: hypothetical protein LBQ80_01525 [Clostridium sp.]|jgi:hypothetical protein|nr:hypothetical protein [Clostridium sp.]
MTEIIRQMPEIRGIADYLRKMRFKKRVFGGCDEENVLDHISEITLMYEDLIASLLLRNNTAAGTEKKQPEPSVLTEYDERWLNELDSWTASANKEPNEYLPPKTLEQIMAEMTNFSEWGKIA